MFGDPVLGGSKQYKTHKNVDTQPVAQRDATLKLSSLLGKGILFAALMSPCPVLQLFPENLKLKQPVDLHYSGLLFALQVGGPSFTFVYGLTTRDLRSSENFKSSSPPSLWEDFRDEAEISPRGRNFDPLNR